LASLEHGTPLGLEVLAERLYAGGHGAAASALITALAGAWSWVTHPDPGWSWQPGLGAIAWSAAPPAFGTVSLAGLVRRLIREREMMAPARRSPAVLVVDDAAALADPVASATLMELARLGRPLRVRLWVVAGPASEVVGSAAGRTLLAIAEGRMSLRDGSSLFDLVDAIGWSAEVSRRIPALPLGWAAMRVAGETHISRVVIGDVVSNAIAGQASRRWLAPVVATA
jgi:hypothetical protein